MSIALAHQVSPTGEPALRLAVREAALRSTTLEVIHVVDSLDADIAEATQAGISDAVDKAVATCEGPTPDWHLHLVAGGHDVNDVSGSILEKVSELAPDVLVIGARRRSPVGKAFLGSVTQSIVLGADVPVLVVKSPR